MLDHDTTVEEAYGWLANDPGYVEHEICMAVQEIAKRARNDRERKFNLGLYPNTTDAQAVENALKSTLNAALFPYGLKVVRRPGYRELMA